MGSLLILNIVHGSLANNNMIMGNAFLDFAILPSRKTPKHHNKKVLLGLKERHLA